MIPVISARGARRQRTATCWKFAGNATQPSMQRATFWARPCVSYPRPLRVRRPPIRRHPVLLRLPLHDERPALADRGCRAAARRRGPRRPARADRLRAHDGLDGRHDRRTGARATSASPRAHRDGLPGGPPSCARPSCSSDLTVPDGQPLVWAMNALGHACAQPRLRPRADGALLRARGADRHAHVPLRRAQPGRARPARAEPAPPLPRPEASSAATRRPSAPLSDEEEDASSTRSTLRRGRRLGRHRRAQAGEVDGRMRDRLDAPVLVGVGAAFDFHAGLVPAGAELDAGLGPGVGLPPAARSRAACGGATCATTRASWAGSCASTSPAARRTARLDWAW